MSQQVTDERSLTVFIRRWNPAQMTLGSFNEVTIYGMLYLIFSVAFNGIIGNFAPIFIADKDNMKSVLSQHSGIPEENIEFAKVSKIIVNETFRFVSIEKRHSFIHICVICFKIGARHVPSPQCQHFRNSFIIVVEFKSNYIK